MSPCGSWRTLARAQSGAVGGSRQPLRCCLEPVESTGPVDACRPGPASRSPSTCTSSTGRASACLLRSTDANALPPPPPRSTAAAAETSLARRDHRQTKVWRLRLRSANFKSNMCHTGRCLGQRDEEATAGLAGRYGGTAKGPKNGRRGARCHGISSDGPRRGGLAVVTSAFFGPASTHVEVPTAGDNDLVSFFHSFVLLLLLLLLLLRPRSGLQCQAVSSY